MQIWDFLTPRILCHAPLPNAFSYLLHKKCEKGRKIKKIEANIFFWVEAKGFIPRKKTFFQSFCFWKCLFLGKKTSTSVWVQTQTSIFFAQLNDFSSFHIFGAKNLKLHNVTSIWSVQHPNAGWNIQQLLVCFVKSALLLKVKMEASGRIKEGF